jgi:hypothetical protein
VADITVQVTSPGQLAFGQGTFGELTFGGDSPSGETYLGSLDAYTNNGWGRLTWGSLVWGLDYQDAIVNVTSPGTPTTYGYQSWGEFDWGQITGVGTDQGTANATISVDVVPFTNLLNVTTGTAVAGASAEVIPLGAVANSTVNSVFGGEVVTVIPTTPGSPTSWGEYAYGDAAWGQITGAILLIGEETLSGDANVLLSTNVATVSTGEEFIIIDCTLTLSTNLLNATVDSLIVTPNTIVDLTSPGNLPWGSEAWGYGTWGNIGGLDIVLGADTVAVPGVEVQVIGQQLNTTIGVLSIIGTANVTLSGVSANISLGEEFAYTDVTAIPTGVLITSVVNTVYAFAETVASPTGVQASVNTGRVFITAWAVVDIGITNNWSVVDIAA